MDETTHRCWMIRAGSIGLKEYAGMLLRGSVRFCLAYTLLTKGWALGSGATALSPVATSVQLLELEGSTQIVRHVQSRADQVAANLLKAAAVRFQIAQAFKPDNVQYLKDVVKTYISHGDLAQAKEALLQISIKDVAPAADIHGELGRYLFQQKQNDLALAELLRSKQSGHQDPDALFMLATLENSVGADKDAIENALGLVSDTRLNYRQRALAARIAGLSYGSLNQFEEAIRYLRLAIQFAPPQLVSFVENCYLALAELYQGKQDPQGARQVLEQGTKILTSSSKLSLALGSMLVTAGDYHAAVQVLTEVSSKFPDEVDAYSGLAEAYTSLGEIKLATRALEEIAQRQPGYPMVDVMIAQSLLREQPPDHEKVLKELDRAEKTSPSDPDIYYIRAKIYIALGRYEDALKAMRSALDLAPTEANFYYQLGMIYQKLGKHVLAREQFERMSHLRSAASPR